MSHRDLVRCQLCPSKEVLLQGISILRNPQAIGDLLVTANMAALGNKIIVLLSYS